MIGGRTHISARAWDGGPRPWVFEAITPCRAPRIVGRLRTMELVVSVHPGTITTIATLMETIFQLSIEE